MCCNIYISYKEITKNLSNYGQEKRRKHRDGVCFILTKLVERVTHKFLIPEVCKEANIWSGLACGRISYVVVNLKHTVTTFDMSGLSHAPSVGVQ